MLSFEYGSLKSLLDHFLFVVIAFQNYAYKSVNLIFLLHLFLFDKFVQNQYISGILILLYIKFKISN